MIKTIKGNAISEADTKKKLNELNKIKKVKIKGKRLINSQKNLLSLFHDLLKTIFNETVNESNINTKMKVKVIMKVTMKMIMKVMVKKTNITGR